MSTVRADQDCACPGRPGPRRGRSALAALAASSGRAVLVVGVEEHDLDVGGAQRPRRDLLLREGVEGVGVAAWAARVCSESSRLCMVCIRTVAYAANATPVTAKPTAIVVSRVTRLASDRR